MSRRILPAFLFLALTAVSAAAQPPPRLAWGPDGRLLVEAGGLLARFELEREAQQLLNDAVTAFALSPDGSRVALASLRGLTLHDYASFREQAQLEVADMTPGRPTALLALAWSPDGRTLAGGSSSGHVLLWEVGSGEQWGDVGVEPASAVASLSFSADGQRLLSAFEDGRAVLWDIEARDVVRQFPAPRTADGELTQETTQMVLSPDGSRILVTRQRNEDARVELLDEEGKVLWERAGRGVEFTPDGAALLALAPPFRIAALYRTSNAEALRVFEPSPGVQELHGVRLSPDGRRLAGVGKDEQGEILIVWNFETGRVIRTRR